MFVPEKITFFIDKATMIAVLGIVLATCGFIMLKNGFETFIHGSNIPKNYTRIKSLMVITVAVALVACGIFTVIRNEQVLEHLLHTISTFIPQT